MTWLIYLMSIADDINYVCGIVIIIGTILAAFAFTIWAIKKFDDDDDLEAATHILSTTLKILTVFGIIGIFTPNSKEIAAMYILPRIMRNESVQQISGKAAELLNLKLDEYLKDLKPVEGK